jgi:hypothetical protein
MNPLGGTTRENHLEVSIIPVSHTEGDAHADGREALR